VSTTAFVSVACGINRYAGLTEQIIQFQGFNQIGIPNQGFIFDTHIGNDCLIFAMAAMPSSSVDCVLNTVALFA